MSYFRKFFRPVLYGQTSQGIENMFILCSHKNQFWELESIQYELLLANKEINFFNCGNIKSAKSLNEICDHFESEHIIYVCSSELSEKINLDHEFINELINLLGPNKKLILLGN